MIFCPHSLQADSNKTGNASTRCGSGLPSIFRYSRALRRCVGTYTTGNLYKNVIHAVVHTVAPYCHAQQHTATQCNTQQHTAILCNTLQHIVHLSTHTVSALFQAATPANECTSRSWCVRKRHPGVHVSHVTYMHESRHTFEWVMPGS